jgi:diguanylate cyclase (GGDEF)-like protein/PAS domain S-box-containing protein
MSLKKYPNQPISMSLSAKVTGIVFWGMVLVGLLVATYILNQRESQLTNEYNNNILLVEHQLENLYILHQAHVFDHKFMSAKVEALFQQLVQQYPLEGIRYEFAGYPYQFGEFQPDQIQIKGQLLIRQHADRDIGVINLDVFMRSFEQTITDSRKQMLMVIGGLVFTFGMILQQILQKVLSKPILNMVTSAQKFAHEDRSARFDEGRNDEFGYLAKFINQALDTVISHQHELEASQKALFEEKMQAQVTLHSIMDGVITTDFDNNIQYLNPVAERLMCMNLDQACETNLSEAMQLIHEETGAHIPSPTVACLLNRQVEVLVNHSALVRNDGKAIPIEATAAPMRNDEGEIIGAVMVFQDVSQERKLSRQLSHQASHDMLTGLFNRRMFEEQLEAALMNVEVEDRHHALCYVDLDQFKVVNDTCGHVAGDELLRQLGDLLKSNIREGDVLARLGGDEFGLLLENCGLNKAKDVAEKVRQSVKDFRFVWQERSFEIGASIGVVGINAENMDLASILASADMACYAAKDMGRNRVHVYEPSDAILSERHGQMHWASRITKALEEQRMVIYEQPVVGIKPGKTDRKHCEILVRMRDEEGVIIRPDTFIPAAERYNLMPTVDRWVIQQVFKHMNSSCCEGLDNVVAINLSGTSLADEDLLTYILDMSDKYQTELNRICFEVTETAAISNLAKATQFIEALKARGCRFSLDDFGSGLSSFTYLKNLPVDYIKIDGSFVVDMINDPVDRAMVDAIVRVGHVMQVKVIAEWVENEETLNLLKEMGVDYAQGYHLGVPKEVVLLELTA